MWKNNKIRILFIIDFIYTLTGGTENQLIKIINNLDKEKYEVYLLSLRKTDWIDENRCNLQCSIQTYNIIKLKNPFHLIKFISSFNYIRKLKPDVVMTFFPLSNIMGVLISKIARVKFIVSTRRDYGLWLDRKGLFLLKYVNFLTAGIIANSIAVKNLTSREEKVNSSKIDVIYNGIEVFDSQQYKENRIQLKNKYNIPLNSYIIGTVSGLKPMKRHEIILKAIKKVLNERYDVSLIIVGDGILREKLLRLTQELKIENKVYFVGSQDNVLKFLPIFDIAVNSSSSEGLSNAIMEYMAYDIPCIVSEAGGNAELIEDGFNGYTFKLDNIDELAEKIISLLDDPFKREKYAEEAKKKIVNHFSLGEMVSQYDKYIMKKLLNLNLEKK